MCSSDLIIDQKKEGILLEAGDLLIVDNRRAVHGRNQFQAYFDGYDRWLQRGYVTRNLQESEILFGKRERIISYDFFLLQTDGKLLHSAVDKWQ